MNTIVSKRWLLARLYEPDLVIVDCRFQLAVPEAGRAAYEQSHIPGAVYLDMVEDLSSPPQKHGGRYPLPDTDKLAARLTKLGIGSDKKIVAYDDQGGIFASRFWWLLQYMGHTDAHVMDEGFYDWEQQGYPLSTEQKITIPSTFVVNLRPGLLASMEYVQEHRAKPGHVLIDSRNEIHYMGKPEQTGRPTGHIPGAINRYWGDSRDSDGIWKLPADQQSRFADLSIDDEIIVYCGGGVSACPNIIALRQAGFYQVKLYAGSWSDWISYSENPIATGEE